MLRETKTGFLSSSSNFGAPAAVFAKVKMDRKTKTALIGLLTEEFCNDSSIQLAQYRANNANSCAIALMSAAMVREKHFRAGGYDQEDLITYSDVDFHRNFR